MISVPALHYALDLACLHGDACREHLWAVLRDRHVVLYAHADARVRPKGIGVVGYVETGLDGEHNALLHGLVVRDAARVVRVHAQPVPSAEHMCCEDTYQGAVSYGCLDRAGRGIVSTRMRRPSSVLGATPSCMGHFSALCSHMCLQSHVSLCPATGPCALILAAHHACTIHCTPMP